MIRRQKVVIYVMCIVMGIFSAGCYSINTVQLSEQQTIAGKDLFAETTRDGRSVRYHKGDLDSLQISGTIASRFSHGRMISSTPIDSVRSIETKNFDLPLTVIYVGATAVAAWEIVYLIFESALKGMRI